MTKNDLSMGTLGILLMVRLANIDSLFPNFANDAHIIRLGLASDGFNPFQTMSVAHSTWLVILVNYNLPPWMFMKPEYFTLSLLILGPISPGNDINIYL